MKQILLFIILTIISVPLFGQNNNENLFNQLVNQFCDCALKAKDINEFETCGNILASTDSIPLTEVDKNHLFTKLKNKCGEAFTKHWGPQRSEVQSCTFLQEIDLKDFNLQKSKVDKSSVQWRNENTDGIIVNLIDHRSSFTSKNLAKKYLKKKNELTMSENFEKTVYQSKIFHSLEIINLGTFGKFRIYQLWARRDKMVYFLTISLLKEDMKIVEKIIDKLSYRVENCN